MGENAGDQPDPEGPPRSQAVDHRSGRERQQPGQAPTQVDDAAAPGLGKGEEGHRDVEQQPTGSQGGAHETSRAHSSRSRASMTCASRASWWS